MRAVNAIIPWKARLGDNKAYGGGNALQYPEQGDTGEYPKYIGPAEKDIESEKNINCLRQYRRCPATGCCLKIR